MATTKITPATITINNTKSNVVTKLIELYVMDNNLVPDKLTTNPGVNSADIR